MTPLSRSATRSYGRFALERMTWHSQLEESRDAKLPCYHTTLSTSLHRCHSPYDHLLVTTPPFSCHHATVPLSPQHPSLFIPPPFSCHHTILPNVITSPSPLSPYQLSPWHLSPVTTPPFSCHHATIPVSLHHPSLFITPPFSCHYTMLLEVITSPSPLSPYQLSLWHLSPLAPFPLCPRP